MSNRLLTVETVAERLAIAPHTVRKMLRDGEIIGRKLRPGKAKSSWRIPETALLAFTNGLENATETNGAN